MQKMNSTDDNLFSSRHRFIHDGCNSYHIQHLNMFEFLLRNV